MRCCNSSINDALRIDGVKGSIDFAFVLVEYWLDDILVDNICSCALNKRCRAHSSVSSNHSLGRKKIECRQGLTLCVRSPTPDKERQLQWGIKGDPV